MAKVVTLVSGQLVEVDIDTSLDGGAAASVFLAAQSVDGGHA